MRLLPAALLVTALVLAAGWTGWALAHFAATHPPRSTFMRIF